MTSVNKSKWKRRRWVLETWPFQFLMGYGLCAPGELKDRKRIPAPDEDFQIELCASRRGEYNLPESICLIDGSGNGIVYSGQIYKIRRILAARLWGVVRDWVYRDYRQGDG